MNVFYLFIFAFTYLFMKLFAYNGRPLGVHRIPIGISLATPVILQWAPLQFNFVVSMHVAWVPLLTISLDILSF
jgi:hypothetical protein